MTTRAPAGRVVKAPLRPPSSEQGLVELRPLSLLENLGSLLQKVLGRKVVKLTQLGDPKRIEPRRFRIQWQRSQHASLLGALQLLDPQTIAQLGAHT